MIRLAFRIWGHGEPRVLFIHGLGDGSFVWDDVARPLRSCSSIAVDLRGHGDSPPDPHLSYHAIGHAADVLRLIEEQGLTEMTLVGHSLGATVAALAAAQAPAKVRKLILIDGGPDVDDCAARAMLQQMRVLPRQFDNIADFEEILLVRHPFASAATLHNYATGALRLTQGKHFEVKFDPAVLHHPDMTAAAAHWAALRSLHCPKFLVRGAASAFLSKARALELCRALVDCRLVTVPHAGHAVPIDNPGGLREAISGFVV